MIKVAISPRGIRWLVGLPLVAGGGLGSYYAGRKGMDKLFANITDRGGP